MITTPRLGLQKSIKIPRLTFTLPAGDVKLRKPVFVRFSPLDHRAAMAAAGWENRNHTIWAKLFSSGDGFGREGVLTQRVVAIAAVLGAVNISPKCFQNATVFGPKSDRFATVGERIQKPHARTAKAAKVGKGFGGWMQGLLIGYFKGVERWGG